MHVELTLIDRSSGLWSCRKSRCRLRGSRKWLQWLMSCCSGQFASQLPADLRRFSGHIAIGGLAPGISLAKCFISHHIRRRRKCCGLCIGCERKGLPRNRQWRRNRRRESRGSLLVLQGGDLDRFIVCVVGSPARGRCLASPFPSFAYPRRLLVKDRSDRFKVHLAILAIGL